MVLEDRRKRLDDDFDNCFRMKIELLADDFFRRFKGQRKDLFLQVHADQADLPVEMDQMFIEFLKPLVKALFLGLFFQLPALFFGLLFELLGIFFSAL